MKVRAVMVIWLVVAAACAGLGVIRVLPAPVVPLMIWGPVCTVALVAARSETAREALAGLDLRALLGFHILRAPIGVLFLVLVARGELDPAFGVVAGWGDLAVGVAMPIAVWLAHRQRGWRVIQAINLFGLVDILLVFVTAQRVIFLGSGLEGLAPLRGFPGGLLPTLIVPWVLLSHAIVGLRLLRKSRSGAELKPSHDG